jgi:hypothetical protein
MTRDEARAKAEALVERVRAIDPEDAERDEAALEWGWNDLASLLDLIDSMRAYLATERKL